MIATGEIKEIRPSDVRYQEREDFTENAVGTEMKSYQKTGFELLKGPSMFKGKILGGCKESIYDIFNNSRLCSG